MKPPVPPSLFPRSAADARSLLADLGAPPHLLRHVEPVGEAAEALVASFHEHRVHLDDVFVRVSVVLHDASKIVYSGELKEPGDEHEPAGERLRTMPVELEELVIALADKLWKGVRAPDLEERVLHDAATRSGRPFWDLIVPFGSCFESVAEGSPGRPESSALPKPTLEGK